MKPVILVLLGSLAFRSCDFFTSPLPSESPIACTLVLTNDAALSSNRFATGESITLRCLVANQTAKERPYHHTGPALYFEILQGEKLIVSSVQGLAWPQVVLVDTLHAGKTDVWAWRAPWIPMHPTPEILPAGTYRAHVVSAYGFIDGTAVHPADITFVVVDKPVPEWVGKLIALFESQPIGTPPQTIWEYTYHGATVYFVPPQCCDQFSVLYDENGEVLGAPDGGIAGHGDGRCPDFLSTRTHERLVWKDARGEQ